MNKNTSIAIAAIVVVAVVVFVVVAINQNATVSPVPAAPKVTNKPQVIKQDAGTTLAAFPKDFPVESGVQNTASYKYIPAHSTEQQSTLEYVSHKTVAQNRTIFSQYLKDGGYKITNKLEQDSLVFYYGTKDNTDLSIKIQKSGTTVTVSASYLKK